MTSHYEIDSRTPTKPWPTDPASPYRLPIPANPLPTHRRSSHTRVRRRNPPWRLTLACRDRSSCSVEHDRYCLLGSPMSDKWESNSDSDSDYLRKPIVYFADVRFDWDLIRELRGPSLFDRSVGPDVRYIVCGVSCAVYRMRYIVPLRTAGRYQKHRTWGST